MVRIEQKEWWWWWSYMRDCSVAGLLQCRTEWAWRMCYPLLPTKLNSGTVATTPSETENSMNCGQLLSEPISIRASGFGPMGSRYTNFHIDCFIHPNIASSKILKCIFRPISFKYNSFVTESYLNFMTWFNLDMHLHASYEDIFLNFKLMQKWR